MDVQSERTGTPAHDGQHGRAPACTACGAAPTVMTGGTKRSGLVQVPASAISNRYRLVCPDCLRRAMQSLGPGRGPEALHTRTCAAAHDDDTRFEVAVMWPSRPLAPPPYWLACAPHLNEALDALTPEGTAP